MRKNLATHPRDALKSLCLHTSADSKARVWIKLNVTGSRSFRTNPINSNTSRSMSGYRPLRTHDTSTGVPWASMSYSSFFWTNMRITVLGCTSNFLKAWGMLHPESAKCNTWIFSLSLRLLRCLDFNSTFSSRDPCSTILFTSSQSISNFCAAFARLWPSEI